MLIAVVTVFIIISRCSSEPMQRILKCIKENCEFVLFNPAYRNVLMELGMNPRTCTIRYVSSYITKHCVLVPPENMAAICPGGDPKVKHCKYTQLKKYNRPCPIAIEEFVDVFKTVIKTCPQPEPFLSDDLYEPPYRQDPSSYWRELPLKSYWREQEAKMYPREPEAKMYSREPEAKMYQREPEAKMFPRDPAPRNTLQDQLPKSFYMEQPSKAVFLDKPSKTIYLDPEPMSKGDFLEPPSKSFWSEPLANKAPWRGPPLKSYWSDPLPNKAPWRGPTLKSYWSDPLSNKKPWRGPPLKIYLHEPTPKHYLRESLARINRREFVPRSYWHEPTAKPLWRESVSYLT